MNIIFTPLTESHFPLLLKWLQTPHVKAWWDSDIQWTAALIQEKYAPYVKGYKLKDSVAKTIHSYIICVDNTPIGYIQIYNAYDFTRSKPLKDLPLKLAALDVYIGEKDYLKQGIASKAIIQFLKEHSDAYTHILVEPDSNNRPAIGTYEKIGFKKTRKCPDTHTVWLVLEKPKD